MYGPWPGSKVSKSLGICFYASNSDTVSFSLRCMSFPGTFKGEAWKATPGSHIMSNTETKLLWKGPFSSAETRSDELQRERAPQWRTLGFVRAD